MATPFITQDYQLPHVGHQLLHHDAAVSSYLRLKEYISKVNFGHDEPTASR